MKTLFPEKAVCLKFVLCSDESFNEVITKKQLNKHISFGENAKQIKRNYVGSKFIGHEDAMDDPNEKLLKH